MPGIHITQLSEIISELPDVIALTPAKRITDRKRFTLYMCALGFEPRCLSIPEVLTGGGRIAKNAVYFQYGTNRDDNIVNRSRLIEALQQIAESVTSFEVDEPEFPQRFRQMVESFNSKSGAEPIEILFDISVAANRLIMKSIGVLLSLNVRLSVLYSEAAVYHPTFEEYEGNLERYHAGTIPGLEHGVSDVSVSEDHPGYHIDPLPDCVILFPSFNKERSRKVIDYVDPTLQIAPGNKVLWLVGLPHYGEDRWRTAAMRALNDLSEKDLQYEVSTFDYKDALQALEAIYNEKNAGHKITVSPMGSKLQALGCAFFSYLHPDVRVVFATPKEYKALQYSSGCKEMWILDLSEVHGIRKLLDAVGQIKIAD
jgi:hypothetical protein